MVPRNLVVTADTLFEQVYRLCKMVHGAIVARIRQAEAFNVDVRLPCALLRRISRGSEARK